MGRTSGDRVSPQSHQSTKKEHKIERVVVEPRHDPGVPWIGSGARPMGTMDRVRTGSKPVPQRELPCWRVSLGECDARRDARHDSLVDLLAPRRTQRSIVSACQGHANGTFTHRILVLATGPTLERNLSSFARLHTIPLRVLMESGNLGSVGSGPSGVLRRGPIEA